MNHYKNLSKKERHKSLVFLLSYNMLYNNSHLRNLIYDSEWAERDWRFVRDLPHVSIADLDAYLEKYDMTQETLDADRELCEKKY